MMPGPYLLDTNILIELFSKKDATVRLLSQLKKSGALCTSLLSVAEIRMGWNDKDAQYYLPLLYDLCETPGITKAIVEQGGQWRRMYREQGITLSTVDTLIAATAYCQNLCLVTRNTKHFLMPELRLYTAAPTQ
jgi:predicted nucleic acid-binding protein